MASLEILSALARMKLRLLDVTYDLRIEGQDYPGLIGELQRLGGVRVQQSKWWLVTALGAEQLRNHLLTFIDGNDSLLVAELIGDVAGWETRQHLRAWMNTVLANRAA